MLVLAMVVFMMVGCVTTTTSRGYKYQPPEKISQEIHYDQKGLLIGRAYVKKYADGTIIKIHYDEAGKYIGMSRTNKKKVLK